MKPSERKTAIRKSDDLTNCSHDECLSPMSSEVEKNNTPRSSHPDDELKQLEEDYQKLLDESQSLINERSYL